MNYELTIASDGPSRRAGFDGDACVVGAGISPARAGRSSRLVVAENAPDGHHESALRRTGHGTVCGNGNGNGNGRESGYTLVMFVMVIALMSIAMGVAVQTASFQMQREREAELIFRGEQFIEAIRLYKIKYGRYPMQLKEIFEAKPRVIRKKWKDPITDSESWGIVFLGQEGQRAGQQGRQLAGPGGNQAGQLGSKGPMNARSGTDDRPIGKYPGSGSTRHDSGLDNNQPGIGQGGAERKMGPIVGVHSTSCDEAIKIYEGHTTYCEWKFIYREQPQRGGAAGPRQNPLDEVPFGAPRAPKRPGAGGGRTGSSGPPPIRTPSP